MLTHRRREPEWMDQPGLDPELHRRALAGLSRINTLSRSEAVFWPEIRGLAGNLGRPIRMLDVACGGGDAILSLGRWVRREGCDLRIDGCDISPVVLRIAEQRARGAGLDRFGFFELDALRQPLPEGYDVIACSLFLHQLSDEDAGQLLKKMAAAARHLVLVSDLRRNATGYALAWLGCRLLTRSPVVYVDGPRSVAAAFTDGELRALAASDVAGLEANMNLPGMTTWPLRNPASPKKPGFSLNLPATTTVHSASQTPWDAVVIGAGPAGALAAREVAFRGARTLLIDRRSFRDRRSAARASAGTPCPCSARLVWTTS